MTATETETPKKESGKQVTKYNILTSDTSGTNWVMRGSIDASSADRAVRLFLEKNESVASPGVQIVAVSTTHWQPKRPKVETHTTIKLL